jgi:putative transposase
MPRPPRIQFAGAIYHIVTRGDGRRALFYDEGHYDRFTNGLAEAVRRSAWEVLAYCWMPNHIHVLLRTLVQYDSLYEAWRGECGGADPATAYRRYVREGLLSAPENPLQSALHDWVLGSQDFLKRVVTLADCDGVQGPGRLRRRSGAIKLDDVIEVVASMHAVDPQGYVGFRSTAPGREMAALLCRRLTSATLAQLSDRFGLGHPDSSANLVRRAKKREHESSSYRQQVAEAESLLLRKTENQG